MTRRGALGAVMALGLLAVIGLGVYSAFGDVHGQARHHLSLAIAAVLTSFLLLAWPPMRPPPGEGVPRARATTVAGKVLITVVWLARCALSGFVGYWISARFQEHPGFHSPVALLSVAGAVLNLLQLCGSAMVGIRPQWPFTRGPASVLRYLLNTAAFAVLAGYATLLPGVLEGAVTGVPSHTYHFWTDLVPGWLTWLGMPLTVITCTLWFFAVLAVEGVVQWLLGAALGRDNALGGWLTEHSPVSYRRTPSEVSFKFNFWVIAFQYYNSDGFQASAGRVLFFTFTSSGDMGMSMFPSRPPRPEQFRAWQALERPMPEDERRALVDRVVTAAVARAPEQWETLHLEYRAVLGHEEVQLEVDPPSRYHGWGQADDEGSAQAGEGHTVVHLTDFPERAALWRLREAAYQAGTGAPHVQTFSISRKSPGSPGDRWNVMTGTRDRFAPPTWQHPPTRTHYRNDLRRFPHQRTHRPFWLRERVSRIR